MPFHALRCLVRVRAGVLSGGKITNNKISIPTSNQGVGGSNPSGRTQINGTWHCAAGAETTLPPTFTFPGFLQIFSKVRMGKPTAWQRTPKSLRGKLKGANHKSSTTTAHTRAR